MLSLLQMLELKLNETFSIILQPFFFKFLVLLPFLLILTYKLSSNSTKSSSPPPSPPKLPIIGNLHQVGLYPHRTFRDLAQRHGPLMLLHLGSARVLVVSSAEAAREIMKTHDITFSNRPGIAFFKKLCYNFKDVASSPYGEYWRQVKGICVLNLLTNKRVHSFRWVREEETKSMINSILNQCSSSSSTSVVDLTELFGALIRDVICRVAMGRKYNDDDEAGRLFKEISMDLTELIGRVNIGDYIPWLAWFTRLNGLDAELDNLAKRFDMFLDTLVQEHMDDAQIKSEDEKDFVDVLLSVQKENVAAGLSIDRVTVKAILLDMFAAGTDTTSTVLEWAMFELVRNPRVMKKLQNEVRKIICNKTDIITEDDLAEMHYLKAVIQETLRLHPPVPLLLPRMSSKDVKINSYDIKANTQVMVNAWQIGRDPKSYDKPDEYEPERFLDNAIDYKANDFQFIPFGAGRRGCPGVQYALAIKEIALANLVHKFDWEFPGGTTVEEHVDMAKSTGSTIHSKYPLKAVAIPYYG